MTPKEKANDLVDTFRMILMSEDTECGNEILCTTIAIKHAEICIDEIIEVIPAFEYHKGTLKYYQRVKEELKLI